MGCAKSKRLERKGAPNCVCNRACATSTPPTAAQPRGRRVPLLPSVRSAALKKGRDSPQPVHYGHPRESPLGAHGRAQLPHLLQRHGLVRLVLQAHNLAPVEVVPRCACGVGPAYRRALRRAVTVGASSARSLSCSPRSICIRLPMRVLCTHTHARTHTHTLSFSLM